MESNFASGVPGIEFYPIVVLVLFFVFFAGLVGWFFLHNRERIQSYALQPFEEEQATRTPNQKSTLAL
jgi:hypothetical protein